jgi:hypothetical protein
MEVHSDEENLFSKDDGITGFESGFIVAEDEIEIENAQPLFDDVSMDDFEGGGDDLAGKNDKGTTHSFFHKDHRRCLYIVGLLIS